MRCVIKHSLPNRLRVQLPCNLDEHQAIALEETLGAQAGITKVTAYPHAASFSIGFDPVRRSRESVVESIAALTLDDLDAWEPTDSAMLAPRPRQLYSQLASATVWYGVRRFLMPAPLRAAWWLLCAVPFWKAALESLRARRLDVPVLDGAAIAIGFTQGANNAGETIFLLNASEMLEDYTQKRAESSLAESLMGIPTTAHVVVGDEERETPLQELAEGNIVAVRTGWAIPVDAEVIDGEAMVNQSTLTGEPLPVRRVTGDTVFAGTTVEEGSLYLRVPAAPEQSRVQSVLGLIRGAEKTKSEAQRRAENLADKLVPWNFALAAAVALTTRSLPKTSATRRAIFTRRAMPAAMPWALPGATTTRPISPPKAGNPICSWTTRSKFSPSPSAAAPAARRGKAKGSSAKGSGAKGSGAKLRGGKCRVFLSPLCRSQNIT